MNNFIYDRTKEVCPKGSKNRVYRKHNWVKRVKRAKILRETQAPIYNCPHCHSLIKI